MNDLLDDYGQMVVLMIFGGGMITFLLMILGHIVSGKTYMKELSAFSGLQTEIRSRDVDVIEGDTDTSKSFDDIDLFYYGGKQNADQGVE